MRGVKGDLRRLNECEEMSAAWLETLEAEAAKQKDRSSLESLESLESARISPGVAQSLLAVGAHIRLCLDPLAPAADCEDSANEEATLYRRWRRCV